MRHRIRFTGGALEAASEQDEFLRKMSSWAMNHAVELSRIGAPLKQERAEIYSHWESDDKVWHLNDAALKLYRAAGGTRDTEASVQSVPSARLQALLLSTSVFELA